MLQDGAAQHPFDFTRWPAPLAHAVRVAGRIADPALERHPHESLIERIWELRGNITAYDAAYVALAAVLACVLTTGDVQLARARGVTREIDLLERD